MGSEHRASSHLPQCVARLLDHRVVGRLVAVKIVHGGGEQVGLKRLANQRGILEHRRQELAFVVIVARLLTQPGVGTLARLVAVRAAMDSDSILLGSSWIRDRQVSCRSVESKSRSWTSTVAADVTHPSPAITRLNGREAIS